jgi:uncharacterized membrane protein
VPVLVPVLVPVVRVGLRCADTGGMTTTRSHLTLTADAAGSAHPAPRDHTALFGCGVFAVTVGLGFLVSGSLVKAVVVGLVCVFLPVVFLVAFAGVGAVVTARASRRASVRSARTVRDGGDEPLYVPEAWTR